MVLLVVITSEMTLVLFPLIKLFSVHLFVSCGDDLGDGFGVVCVDKVLFCSLILACSLILSNFSYVDSLILFGFVCLS
jgi:hypothetical protein